jgi:HK97 family phage portal protein
MQFTIPYTNIKIALGVDPLTSKSRGYARGKFSNDPEHDFRGYKTDPRSLYTAWRNSTDIYGCIREIHQGVAAGGHKFYTPTDPDKEKAPSEADEAIVRGILEYQYGSINRFKRKVFVPRMICGNTYIEIVNNDSGFMLGVKALDSRIMAIVSDEFGTVYRYVQNAFSDGGFFTGGTGSTTEPVYFDPEEIIHWKMDEDPNAEVFGMSPLEHAIWEARADMAAMVSNYKFFENDAVPGVWYVLDEKLTPEQAQTAYDWINKNLKGVQNRGKAATVQGVKDIKTLRLTNAEMQFLEGRHFGTEKICAAYGVPKVLLGYTDGVNYTNHEGQRMEFYNGTVKDEQEEWESLINHIIKMAGQKYKGLEKRIAYKAMPPVFDTEEILYNRAINARQAGLVTTNKARAMIGEEPLDTATEGDMGDRIILGAGNSAVLLTDIGITEPTPQQELDQVKETVKRYAPTDNVQKAR